MFKKMSLSAIALMAIAGTANAQGAVTFGQFFQNSGATNFTLNNGGVNSTITSGAGLFTFNVNGTIFSDVSLAITNGTNTAAVLTPNSPNPGQTTAVQDFSGITFAFTRAGGAVNVLTASTSSAAFSSVLGNDSASASASTGTGQTVTFSSDFVNFVGSTERSFSFSFSGLTPNSSVDGANFFDTTSFAGTGTFSTNAPAVTGVPEPSAVAFAMVAGAGLVGMMVRARRK